VQRTRGERFVASARPDPEHSPRSCDETGTMYSLNIWIVNIFEGSLVVNKGHPRLDHRCDQCTSQPRLTDTVDFAAPSTPPHTRGNSPGCSVLPNVGGSVHIERIVSRANTDTSRPTTVRFNYGPDIRQQQSADAALGLR